MTGVYFLRWAVQGLARARQASPWLLCQGRGQWVSERGLPASPYSFVRTLTTATKETKVGIIGCGQVGQAVTHNLVRQGYTVTAVLDTDPARLTALPPATLVLSTPAEVINACDVVFTCLPKPANVKAVAKGSSGLLEAMTAGKIWVDHSTTDYEQTEHYMEVVKGAGGYMLEAPITGGLDALKKGQMMVYLGGDKTVVQAVTPLLQASYSKVFYVGETVGAAMIIKVVSNMLCCVHVVAMGEALMLGKRANIDLRTFWDAIRLSVGNSFVWETAAPVVFNGGDYDPGFSLDLQNKDLQLGYDMARKFKVPMALHGLTLSTYRQAEFQYGSQAGCYIIPKGLEDALEEDLRAPGFSEWEYNIVIEQGSLNVTHKGRNQE